MDVSPLLIADQLERFYRFKKESDPRYALSTVKDLFADDDELSPFETENGDEASNRYSWLSTIDQQRARIRKSLNKKRFLAEQLHLAQEQLATDRAILELERHLLAITTERMNAKAAKRSSATSLCDLMNTKVKGNLPESFSLEALLDVDKNNNQVSSAEPPSTSESITPTRNFELNVKFESQLRQHFPKLLDRCRKLSNVNEAVKLQQVIKLYESLMDYLFLKVESMIFKKSFRKPIKSCVTTSRQHHARPTPSDGATTNADEIKRKRKQLTTNVVSRIQASTSEVARNNTSRRTSIDNPFRDVIGGSASSNKNLTSSSNSTMDSFKQVTIEIVDP